MLVHLSSTRSLQPAARAARTVSSSSAMLVKGGDYGIDQVVGADIVSAYGGTVKVLGLMLPSPVSWAKLPSLAPWFRARWMG